MANNNQKVKIGIIDTMFSRVNMGKIATEELESSYGPDIEIIRKTVPGIKDLAVECKLLLDNGCGIVLALGMVGGAAIDQQCAHEASIGIQHAKLQTNKHIIEVFIHENEAWSEQEFFEICNNRIRKHTHNAIWLIQSPEKLIQLAGKGVRQGKEDEGELSTKNPAPITLGIIISDFNSKITKIMESEAIKFAKKQNAEIIGVIHVPGAYDIPLAAKKLLLNKKIDAIVALGAVIKGDTKHDELIANSIAISLTNLSLEFKKPITLGIIGPDATEQQAGERKEEYAKRAVEAAILLVKRLRN